MFKNRDVNQAASDTFWYVCRTVKNFLGCLWSINRGGSDAGNPAAQAESSGFVAIAAELYQTVGH